MPTPAILWSVPEGNTSATTVSDTVGEIVSSMLILDTTTRSDAGNYTCTTFNSAGMDEATFQLTLHGEKSYIRFSKNM